MKTILGFVLLACGSASAAPLDGTTSIDAVTVYPAQALVLRKGEIRLPAGGARVRIGGLPASIEDDSVRVLVGGAARPVLIGASVEPVPAAEEVVPEARAIEKELEQLSDEDRALASKLQHLSDQRSFLAAFRSGFDSKLLKELGAQKPDPRTWAAADAFLHQELGGILTEVRKLSAERRALAGKIELARRKLEQLRSKRGTLTKALTLDVQSTSGGDASLTVRYLVPGVTWRSLYDARLRGSTVTLTHYAFVTQESGEDWDNVRLSVSTADTERRVQIPRLVARNLEVVAPHAPAIVTAEKSAPARRDSAPGPPPPPPPPAEPAPEAEARRAEFVTTYEAATRVSIPSSPAGRKTSLAAMSLPATLEHVSVPKRAQGAYLIAVGRLGRDLPLPGGEVSLFFGSEYVGSASIDSVVPGGEVRLPFGRDERVRVERQLLERKRHEQGLLSKEERYDFRYRIRIANNSTRAVDLVVLDQVPVSQHEKIQVQLAEQTTPRAPAAAGDAPGLLRWRLRLEPGQRTDLALGYTVAYPLGSRIAGMDGR